MIFMILRSSLDFPSLARTCAVRCYLGVVMALVFWWSMISGQCVPFRGKILDSHLTVAHPVGHTDMHIATRPSGGDAYGTTLMQRSE